MSTTTNIEGMARRLATIRDRARVGDCTPDDVRWLLGSLDAGEQIAVLEELSRWRQALDQIREWAESGHAGARRSPFPSDTNRAVDAGYETAASEVLEILAATGALAEVPR